MCHCQKNMEEVNKKDENPWNTPESIQQISVVDAIFVVCIIVSGGDRMWQI